MESKNIFLYNLVTKALEEMSDDDIAPQVVSADHVAKVIYWVNFEDGRYVIMETTYNKQTQSLGIGFTSELSITQDMLYLYVLVLDISMVYKYKKSTWEREDSFNVSSSIEQILAVFGRYSIVILSVLLV